LDKLIVLVGYPNQLKTLDLAGMMIREVCALAFQVTAIGDGYCKCQFAYEDVIDFSNRSQGSCAKRSDGNMPRRCISALLPDNQSSREFAKRKHTRAPRGTVEGESASAPIEGTLGLANPAKGPIRGALSEALTEMNIPPDWPGVERVLDGEVLLTVQCHTREECNKAIEVLQQTGAENIDSVQQGD
jgi:hypothetical protein